MLVILLPKMVGKIKTKKENQVARRSEVSENAIDFITKKLNISLLSHDSKAQDGHSPYLTLLQ